MITGKDYFLQLFSTASNAHQSGDLKKAKALYRQLTIDMPNQAEPFHMLAVIAAENGQLDKSVSYFEKAIALKPNNPLYKTNYAETLIRLDQKEEAKAQLEQAVKLDPNLELAKQKIEKLR